MLDLSFHPDASSGTPLYDQLASSLRELIEAGRLGAGEQLPPTRDLASSLGLSRNTVNRAYETLAGAGFLNAKVGRGTFVAPGRARPDPYAGSRREPGLAWSAVQARRSRRLALPALAPLPPEEALRFDFRPGRVDPAALPLAELQRAYARAIQRLPECANEIEPLGWPPLRQALARRLAGRGIRCGADELLIVSGAQQALDLIARVIVDSEETVALENPGYFGATLAFRAAGAHTIGIDVDEAGLRVDDLERAQRRRRLRCVYTTPASQLPTGVALAPERRNALLAFARREQVPVVEDDYDAELRVEGAAPPALKQRDPGDLVLYTGTFSKSLFPGLRIGYLLAPAPLRVPLATARITATMQAGLVDQLALTELLETDALDRHIRRMRRHYGAKRQALLDALEAEMPPEVRATPPAGGNGVWVALPDAVDVEPLLRRAAAQGIAAGFGPTFCVEGTPRSALLLSCAVASDEAMREGVARLAALIREGTA